MDTGWPRTIASPSMHCHDRVGGWPGVAYGHRAT